MAEDLNTIVDNLAGLLRINGVPPVVVDRTFGGIDISIARPILPEGILFYNNSGSTVPAYGCMAVTGYDAAKSSVKIAKPSTTFTRDYLVNSNADIANGALGYAQNRTNVIALYNTAPSPGDGMGPTPSQWYLTKNYPQTAIVRDTIDTTAKTVEVSWFPIQNLIGKPNASIAANASGTINIYQGTLPLSSLSVISSLTISACNVGPAVTTSDYVDVGYRLGQLCFSKLC